MQDVFLFWNEYASFLLENIQKEDKIIIPETENRKKQELKDACWRQKGMGGRQEGAEVRFPWCSYI